MNEWTEPHEGYNEQHGYNWRWHRHVNCHEARRTVRAWPDGAAIIYTIGMREVTVEEFRAHVGS